MTKRTYFLETFGCQMNILDSELVDGELRHMGLTPTTDPQSADVILFNTCSVRQHAEDKVLSRLGNLKRRKKLQPELVVGVLGCMAERIGQDLFTTAPHLDLICGPGELNQLPALLQEVWQRHEHVAALTGTQSRRTETLQRALEYDSLEALDLSRAPAPQTAVLQSYIRVQRGCDKFCTYCVVPFTRGKERSRPPQHILDEARRLIERGCREITLLGQTVNSYVHQEDGRPVPFAQLLERMHALEGLDRIRFITSYPADWDDDILRVMRDNPRICPYLHIPAQSGSDRILKAMRRNYSASDYLRLIDRARHFLPQISLSGDFIVGFCNESEDDFQASADLIRRVQYESLFVFKYSPRPGTAADRVKEDNIPDAVKAERNNALLAIQSEIAAKRKAALVGQSVEVLVEGLSKAERRAQGESASTLLTRGRSSRTGPDNGEIAPTDANAPHTERHQLVGRTTGDIMTIFEGPASHIGAIVRVRIERNSPLTLFGRVEDVISPARPAIPDPTTPKPTGTRPLPIV